jgi:hypothetical protein
MDENLMKCSIDNRQRATENYLEGNLSQTEQNAFEEHIFNCDRCFQELRMQESIRDLVKYEGNVLFAETLEKRRKPEHSLWELITEKFSSIFIASPRRLAYASIAVLVLLLIIFIMIPSGPPIDPQNFTESGYLEELMSTSFRSPYSFDIISPQNGTNVKKNIEFKWDADYEGSLYITILNNKEVQELNFTVEKNQLLIKDLDEKLQPGLYYWKLEGERNIFHVGKFYLRKP